LSGLAPPPPAGTAATPKQPVVVLNCAQSVVVKYAKGPRVVCDVIRALYEL